MIVATTAAGSVTSRVATVTYANRFFDQLQSAFPATIQPTDPGGRLSVMSTANRLYRLQWKARLEDTVWRNLGDPIPGTGGPVTFTPADPQASRRYYRVASFPLVN